MQEFSYRGEEKHPDPKQTYQPQKCEEHHIGLQIYQPSCPTLLIFCDDLAQSPYELISLVLA